METKLLFCLIKTKNYSFQPKLNYFGLILAWNLSSEGIFFLIFIAVIFWFYFNC